MMPCAWDDRHGFNVYILALSLLPLLLSGTPVLLFGVVMLTLCLSVCEIASFFIDLFIYL